MSYLKQKILLLLIYLEIAMAGLNVRKIVYQRDLSNHCLRRVMPSVFLGRHVVDAYSQILHFSRMELPYSCLISVRTESGSNIILVTQLASDENLVTACQESSNQLLVYQMGETFGGYWGRMPDSLITQHPPVTKVYTLTRTVRPIKRTTVSQNTEVRVTLKKSTTPKATTDAEERQDFINVVIPLVNISAKFISGAQKPEDRAFNQDRNLDMLYDTLPREHNLYQTTILPLVQFSIKKQNPERQGDEVEATPRYQLDYEFGNEAQDFRVTYPQVSTKRLSYPKYKNYVNRRLKFPQKKSPFLNIRSKPSYIQRLQLATRKQDMRDYSTDNNIISSETSEGSSNFESWDSIEDLMVEFNKSMNKSVANDDDRQRDNITELLQKISETKYNGSVYLYTKRDFDEHWVNNDINSTSKNGSLSTSNIKLSPSPLSSPSLLTTDKISTLQHFQIYKEKYTINNNTTSKHDVDQKQNVPGVTYNVESSDHQLTVAGKVKTQLKEVENKSNLPLVSSTLPSATNMIPVQDSNFTGSLVDHKSWENVVQVAPDIAVLLNKSDLPGNIVNISGNNDNSNSNFQAKNSPRQKRHIAAIPIGHAKPYNITTVATAATTMSSMFQISDVQEFIQLVELHDDGLQDRLFLNRLLRYSGPLLFNICDINEPQSRHVYLFNSSRIVIAITNFTMQTMTIVMTPAQTLLNGEARCQSSHLECQVTGTRVCIDSMSACDGVPNCGAYDIYDEDRLMCGAAEGLQHNVCLAALTFLAVMLTVLYAVQHWLRRCVPRVSEAFFIYINRNENILYLDPIMRSPNDIYDPRVFYEQTVFEDDTTHPNNMEKRSKNIVHKWLRKCCNLFKKEKVEEKPLEIEKTYTESNPTRRLYSFAELEIRKIIDISTVNVSVQTGESLEMHNLKISNNNGNSGVAKSSTGERESPKFNLSTVSSEDYQKFVNELSMIKLFREARVESQSLESKESDVYVATPDPYKENRNIEEKEIKSLVYDRHRHDGSSHATITSRDHTIPTIREMRSDKPRLNNMKNLRFDEETKTIPNLEYEEDLEQNIPDSYRTYRETVGHNEDQVASTSRDFKRFFRGSKGKKPKKITHMPLH